MLRFQFTFRQHLERRWQKLSVRWVHMGNFYKTAGAIKALKGSSSKKKSTEHIRTFFSEAAGEEALVFYVQDPFQRLLIHGVCEDNTWLLRQEREKNLAATEARGRGHDTLCRGCRWCKE
nr:R3H domain-containing protein 4 [Tanacetum cinerariifolium]